MTSKRLFMNDDFIESLASPMQPVPGGGAAAAHAACVGLALLEKIARLELNRSDVASLSRREFWSSTVLRVVRCREALALLRERDGESYLAWAAEKASNPSSPATTALLLEAVHCPLHIMEEAGKGMNILPQAMEHCKRHLLSDLLVVRELLEAAIRGAAHIAGANLAHIPPSPEKDKLFRRLEKAKASSRLSTADPA